jgi:hypothetical protein
VPPSDLSCALLQSQVLLFGRALTGEARTGMRDAADVEMRHGASSGGVTRERGNVSGLLLRMLPVYVLGRAGVDLERTQDAARPEDGEKG